MSKAVIYTRVSTDEQAKNNLSLKGQRDAAYKYCDDSQIEVVAFFSDEGESAKTADRPELIAILDYCKANYKEVDYLIVWKLDRLARQAADHHFIKSILIKHGVQLLSVTEPIDDTPTGRLMETMLAGYAQFDNDVRAERSVGGVKRRTEEGGWPHMAPLGYINFRDELRRPTLKPSNAAPLIGKWLREYLKGGLSQHDMYELAFSMGIRSKSGRKVSYQQACNMLRNPVYAGLIFSKLVDVPVKGLHDALISMDEHLAILELLEGKRKNQPLIRGAGDWPMRGGFVRCDECSKSLTGSAPKGRIKRYPMYHCTFCRAGVVGHRVSISKDELHLQFEAYLENITPSATHMKLFRAVFIKKLQEAHIDQRQQQQRLEKDLTQLRERKGKIIDLFIDGQLTPDEKKGQSTRIDTQILRTELQLNETRAIATDTETIIDFGINMIGNIPKLWRTATDTDRKRLQFVVFPDGLKYNFVDGFGTAKTGDLYQLIAGFEEFGDKKSNVVATSGLEPPTPGL